MNIYPLQSALIYLQKLNLFPDTCIRKSGTPVPSKHIMALSDFWKTLHGILSTENSRVLFMLLSNKLNRRSKCNLQLVFSRLKQFLHAEIPGSVHIIRTTYFFTIQRDDGDGIKSFKAKYHFLRSLNILRGHFHLTGVHKVILHEFQCFILIISPVRIFQQPCRNHIIINRSRDVSLNLGRRPINMHFPFLIFINSVNVVHIIIKNIKILFITLNEYYIILPSCFPLLFNIISSTCFSRYGSEIHVSP